jgi:hypothetical protein
MFDLLANGQIAIDMTDAEGSPVRVLVNPPPTVGALKRLRRKAEEIDAEALAYAEELDRPLTEEEIAEGKEPLSPQKKRQLVQARNDETAIAWWTFTLLGDESWKGLAPDVPAESDEWPVYMATIESMAYAQGHWRTTPLARGGKLVAETN